MSLLVYCVTQVEAQAPASAGVRNAPVESVELQEVRAWYSVLESPTGWTADDAFAVHKLTSEFLSKGAVLPFRFPTIVDDLTALRGSLSGSAATYATELRRLAPFVQMEVRLTPPVPAAGTDESGPGAAYLRQRSQLASSLEAAAERLRQAISPVMRDFKRRDQLCYVLLPRDTVERFGAMVRQAGIAPEVQVRVSGPWPPLQFAALGPVQEMSE